MKKRLLLLTIVLAVAFSLQSAWADKITIDFRGGSGGDLSFNPSLPNATLSVSNAPLDQVFLVSAGLSSAKTIVGGLLNFETGAVTSGYLSDSDYTGFFGSGGSFTISGAVPSLGINDTNTQLLSGIFGSKPGPYTGNYVSLMGSSGDGTFSGLLYIMNINDTLSQYYFGMPGSGMVGGGSVAQPMLSVAYAGNTFSGEISSSNVKISVAEPATFALIGAGLIVVAGFMRKRVIHSK